MKTITALKTYFESEPHGRKVTMEEIKALSKEERQQLAAMACDEMGETLEVAA